MRWAFLNHRPSVPPYHFDIVPPRGHEIAFRSPEPTLSEWRRGPKPIPRATSGFIWLPHIILDCYQRQATHITAGPRGLSQKRTAGRGQNELKRKKERKKKNKFKNQKYISILVTRSLYTLL